MQGLAVTNSLSKNRRHTEKSQSRALSKTSLCQLGSEIAKLSPEAMVKNPWIAISDSLYRLALPVTYTQSQSLLFQHRRLAQKALSDDTVRSGAFLHDKNILKLVCKMSWSGSTHGGKFVLTGYTWKYLDKSENPSLFSLVSLPTSLTSGGWSVQ
jgi:hypothetical protein